MRIAFGYEVKSEHDYYLQLAQEGMRVASLAATPGKWLVDSFPICMSGRRFSGNSQNNLECTHSAICA